MSSATADVITGEARFILQHLASNAAEGIDSHMADVRGSLEDVVTLDFADYLKFLKKFNYITLNRQEHTLGLTESGNRVVEGFDIERFSMEISDYFSHRIDEPNVIVDGDKKDSTRVGRPVHDTRFVKYDAIGSGGLGTVFKGKHTALGVDVAIKEIKDLFGYFSFLQRNEVSERLERAVRAQAQLIHPNVVRIIDLDPDVAHPFFVMEYCPGGSLREALDRTSGKGFVEKRALRYFLQSLYALRAAHGQGLIHRNLKPENLLIDSQGNIRLSDFGLTTILEVDPSKVAALPQVFLSMGSMTYMAPEQLKKGGEITALSDIFSLGILFYEMLTGEPPGRRAPLPSVAKKGLSKKVDSIFDKMTHDRPEDRYPSVDAILEDFYSAFDAYGAEGDLILSVDLPEDEGPHTALPPPAKSAPAQSPSKAALASGAEDDAKSAKDDSKSVKNAKDDKDTGKKDTKSTGGSKKKSDKAEASSS